MAQLLDLEFGMEKWEPQNAPPPPSRGLLKETWQLLSVVSLDHIFQQLVARCHTPLRSPQFGPGL